MKSRKLLRKEKRMEKKLRRIPKTYKVQTGTPNEKTNSATVSDSDVKANNKSDVRMRVNSKDQNLSASCVDEFAIKHKNEKRRRVKLEKQMKAQRRRNLIEANKEDDKMIKQLEKKLGLNKRKSKSLPKSFANDGLDYLLEVCDSAQKRAKNAFDTNDDDSHDSDVEDDSSLRNERKRTKTSKSRFHSEVDSKIELKSDFSDDDDEIGSEFSDGDDGVNQSEFLDSDEGMDQSEFSVDEGMDESEFSVDDEGMDQSEFSDDDEMEPESNEEVSKNFIREKSLGKKLTKESKKIKNQKLELSDNETISSVSKKSTNAKPSNNLGQSEKIKSNRKTETRGKNNLENRLAKLKAFVNESANEQCISQSDESSDDQSDNASKSKRKDDSNSATYEDIYGRLRNKEGELVEPKSGKYVPPHMRANELEKSESFLLLKRQTKGLLNRLTENNMHNIRGQIEELYANNSRNNTNQVITDLMTESLITSTSCPERLIIEHAMLIAILHANVGSEIGAHFLQHYATLFDKIYKKDCQIEDKTLDNVVALLCQFYNFKITHCRLIYDILERLLINFGEKEIELILIVLKTVGFNLRKDDPQSLKELIVKIQAKSSESKMSENSSRTRFMLDILLAVKNNNALKIPQYDPEHSIHLKKILKSMLHAGKYVSELKISLNDLLSADEQGRWWIVGSAWSKDSNPSGNEANIQENGGMKFSQKVLQLAKKQRMNTDTRRNIFCIIMTAEDYMDAFEKLLKLSLKGRQYLEIVHVLTKCLLQEKHYNPYYTYLAEQLCACDRKYQIAIQFTCWDKFKDFSSLSSQQIRNIAEFLSYLFVEGKLSLSILKVLPFTEINKPMVKLLRRIMLNILLNESEETIAEVFSRIAKSPSLLMLREGLRLFLHHFLRNNIEASKIYKKKLALLPSRIELAESIFISEV